MKSKSMGRGRRHARTIALTSDNPVATDPGLGPQALAGVAVPADHRGPWSSRWSSSRIRTRIRRTRERLGRQLRNELRALDVDEVDPGRGRPLHRRARRGSSPALTEWLVTLSGGGGVFVSVIGTIKAWLGGRAGAHKVTVTIDGDTLELSSATAAERAESVETFVRRHQPA